MKASYLDFLISGGVISIILAATVSGVIFLLPLSKAVALEYHVIVELLLGMLLYGLFSALAVRVLLLLRPVKCGDFDMDSAVFTYWKLLTVIYRLGQGVLLTFTPVFAKPLVEMLFGARVGANVALGGTIDDPYMVTIGEGSVLGHASLVSGNMVHGGKLTCGPVIIGVGVTVGVNSVILPNTEIGDNATVMGGSYVMPGTKIPAGETWKGNPARKWM